MARCLARPSGGNEDRAARLCPVGRLSSRRARLLCSALLQCLFFFASLVLQEQLLRDPTHSYTWLPPSLPLPAQGLPWGAQEKGMRRGAPRITLVPVHLCTWQRHAPMSETGRAIRLEEAALSLSSPETEGQTLGCGAEVGLLGIRWV